MATEKSKSKAEFVSGPIEIDARVQVLTGDYGNSRGTVWDVDAEGVWIVLDAEVDQDHMTCFSPDNIKVLP